MTVDNYITHDKIKTIKNKFHKKLKIKDITIIENVVIVLDSFGYYYSTLYRDDAKFDSNVFYTSLAEALLGAPINLLKESDSENDKALAKVLYALAKNKDALS